MIWNRVVEVDGTTVAYARAWWDALNTGARAFQAISFVDPAFAERMLRTLPDSTQAQWPGGSDWMSPKQVCGSGTEPNIQTRVKMGQTSNVFAVVKSDGKFFMASKEIKVTLGGCGG